MSDEPECLLSRQQEEEIERLRIENRELTAFNERLIVAMGRATDLATAAIYQLNERKWQQF